MSNVSIRARVVASLGLALAFCSGSSASPWVQFQDETATRLSASHPEVGEADVEEKDYAWGDIDNDGDIDLVVVRKSPWESSGQKNNILFLNEAGVLVDRTSELAVASDVLNDFGFLTPTNDRDVQLADLDLDGWLDVVTAVTFSDGIPKEWGHPRVYRNLGADGQSGEWLGLRYETARIPVLGQPGSNPRFSSVAVGDVTGDGYPDLWFGQEQSSGSPNFEDRLLVNQGLSSPGFFVDETQLRITAMLPQGFPFHELGKTPAGAVADLNDDGASDLVRIGVVASPFVAVAYNEPGNAGVFDGVADLPYSQDVAPYFLSTGDLDNDGLLDLVVTDDGDDVYLLNEQDGAMPTFTQRTFTHAFEGTPVNWGDGGPGGNSVVADLDNDGWNDVLIADVDLELESCSGRMHLYHNQGPGSDGPVVLEEQMSGTWCALGNPPSCLVTGIPADKLEGTHDVAVFDIDGDGWKDLVIGRCDGTVVLMNVPPPAAGGVPDGDGIAGTPLTVGKEPGARISLVWGASCGVDDADYEIYGGGIGDFTSHAPVSCSTAGATSRVFVPASGDRYYLVVPRNDQREGSYGRASDGLERPQAANPCLPIALGACEG